MKRFILILMVFCGCCIMAGAQDEQKSALQKQAEAAKEKGSVATSRYTYIRAYEDYLKKGQNKQALLLETLRVLKKGGTFAIHDLMSKARYGDMDAFVRKLKAEGYEDVRLIDTTDGRFMGRKEAAFLGLGGSTLLVGRK